MLDIYELTTSQQTPTGTNWCAFRIVNVRCLREREFIRMRSWFNHVHFFQGRRHDETFISHSSINPIDYAPINISKWKPFFPNRLLFYVGTICPSILKHRLRAGKGEYFLHLHIDILLWWQRINDNCNHCCTQSSYAFKYFTKGIVTTTRITINKLESEQYR